MNAITKLIRKAKSYNYRDSRTGRFIRKAYALLNPNTTEKEERK